MKKLFFLIFVLILPLAYAVDITANPENVLETPESYIFDLNGKVLVLDKASMSDLNVKITDEGIEIEGIKIRQLENNTAYVYYGKPEEKILKSDISLVYIVDHYFPDLEITNPKRLEGFKRTAVIVKNAKVEIQNGLVLDTDGLKIKKDSFFGSTEDKEIDIIKGTKLFEIYVQAKELIIRAFDSFEFSSDLDRGYSGKGENIEPEIIETEKYYDVIEGEKIE